jgi:Fe-S-cluster-containing dehydrogenase component
MACPYGIPSFGEDGKMKKCDACIERQKAGMLPACIKVCPTGALTLLTEEEFVKRQEKERAKKAEEMLREYSKTDYR